MYKRQDLLRTRADLDTALNIRAEFLANMSHELRTPLSGLLGATELVLTTPLLKEQRDLIQTANDCGQTLLVLVNDILDFATIESHTLSLKSLEFDLAACVTNALEPLIHKATRKGLELNLSLDESIPSQAVSYTHLTLPTNREV